MNKFLLILLSILLIQSCKKEEEQNQPSPSENKPLVVAEKGVELSMNSLSLDSTITSTDTTVTINITDPVLLNDITAGSVLMNNEEGFLVTVVEKNGNTLMIEQASLQDYFTGGRFEFGSQLDQSSNKTSEGFEFAFNYDKTLFENENSAISFTGGIKFTPDIKGDIDFDENTFYTYIENAPLQLTGNLHLEVTADNAYSSEAKVLLGKASKTVLHGLVLTTYTVKVYSEITVTASGSITEDFTLTSNNSVSGNIRYDNGWTSDLDVSNDNNEFDFIAESRVNVEIKNSLKPVIEVEFYKFLGAYIGVEPYTVFNLDLYGNTEGNFDWGFIAEKGVNGELGATERVFSNLEYNYPFNIIDPVTIYEVPTELELLSEESVEGTTGELLEDPVKVSVKDSEGDPVAGSLVYAQVTEGNGSIQEGAVFTDANGIAQFDWTLGEEPEQKLRLHVNDGTGALKDFVEVEFIDGSIDLSGFWYMDVSGPCSFGMVDFEKVDYKFEFNPGGSLTFSTVLSDGYEVTELNATSINQYELIDDQLSIDLQYEYTEQELLTDCDDESGETTPVTYTNDVIMTLTYNPETNEFTGSLSDTNNPNPITDCTYSHNCSPPIRIYQID